jgi:hypothetical protein
MWLPRRKDTKSYRCSESRSCLRESLGMRIQNNGFVFVFSLSHFYKQCVLLESVKNNYRRVKDAIVFVAIVFVC